MEHSAQGKHSDTLGLPMLEQSRPERAKALKPVIDNVIATVFHVCFYITKFKYHLCYYLNLFAILAKGTVR